MCFLGLSRRYPGSNEQPAPKSWFINLGYKTQKTVLLSETANFRAKAEQNQYEPGASESKEVNTCL